MAEAQKPSAAPERTRVLLILDCSQSMWDKWQSDAKIKVTQKVLLRLLDSIGNLPDMEVALRTGFTCADEMLYPENHKYLDDLLAYVAVGARSVEDQQHRLTASGIEVPAGMKNPTSGDLRIMMNSIHAAQSSHTFVYRGWEATSQGNPFAHAILRGYTNSKGEHHPNYHYEDIIRVCDEYDKRPELVNPAVIVDANHENSGKDPLQQPRIVKEVLANCRYSERIARIVKGFMIESYIEDGRQEINGGCYGKSITDACLGWDKSERLIYEIAELL